MARGVEAAPLAHTAYDNEGTRTAVQGLALPLLQMQTHAWLLEVSVMLSDICLLLLALSLGMLGRRASASCSQRWWALRIVLAHVWLWWLSAPAAAALTMASGLEAAALIGAQIAVAEMSLGLIGPRTVFLWGLAKLTYGLEELRPAQVLQQELVAAGWGWIMACGFRQLVRWAHVRCGAMLRRERGEHAYLINI